MAHVLRPRHLDVLGQENQCDEGGEDDDTDGDEDFFHFANVDRSAPLAEREINWAPEIGSGQR